MSRADSLRFDIIDHVLLVVHADMPPDDADWARLDMVRNANIDRIHANLVIAPPRASINAAQRAQVAQYMRRSGSSIAVITDSALIRGVARAISFLGVQVNAFAPNQLDSALNFLMVPASRHADWIRRIDAMSAQLKRDSGPMRVAR